MGLLAEWDDRVMAAEAKIYEYLKCEDPVKRNATEIAAGIQEDPAIVYAALHRMQGNPGSGVVRSKPEDGGKFVYGVSDPSAPAPAFKAERASRAPKVNAHGGAYDETLSRLRKELADLDDNYQKKKRALNQAIESLTILAGTQ